MTEGWPIQPEQPGWKVKTVIL